MSCNFALLVLFDVITVEDFIELSSDTLVFKHR